MREQSVCEGEGRGLCVGEGGCVCEGEGRGLCVGEGRCVCEGEGRGLCVGEGQTPSSYTWYVPFLVFDDLNVMFLCEVHCLIPVLPHACVQEISLHTSTASM